LYRVSDFGDYRLLGKTVDDAAGEALDKAGKLLGLPYPGGIAIDHLTRKTGNRHAFDFPIGLNQRDNLNFSFSGLKTSLVYRLKKMGLATRKNTAPSLNPTLLRDLAASYQEAVVSALIRKTSFALQETGLAEVVVTGGVASNHRLRERLAKKAEKEGFHVMFPQTAYCTDNAAMIAFAGYLRLRSGQQHDFSLNAVSRLSLESL
jgi:N6-L-threonylcarbamoyladenine synthase